MKRKVRCPAPRCGAVLAAPEGFSGKAIRCPRCGGRVPLASSAEVTRPAGAPPHPQPLSPASGERGERKPLSPTAGEADLPRKVGRFEVRARLGSGAFGTVYRAYDPQLDREVALKVPRAGALDGPAALRFLREARAAARLGHPNIVPVYNTGSEGETHYIASAFIEGRSLAAALEGSALPAREAARLARGLAEALAYAHGQGVVHRDVKPANVLLDAHGTPHLLDFGLAWWKEEERRLTQDGAILGTPAYMAPEQAAGQRGEPLPASDQYGLGVVLYEMLTGRVPFSGPAPIVLYNAVHREPPPPRSVHDKVPRDLETVCLRALAKRPEDRYAGCGELADELRRWLDGEPVRARPLGPLERLARWGKREPVLALAAAAAVLALVAVVGVATAKAVEFRGLAGRAAEARQQAESAQRQEAEARRQAEEEVRAEEAARQQAEEEKQKVEAALARVQAATGELNAARQEDDAKRAELEKVATQLEKENAALAKARREAERRKEELAASRKRAAEAPRYAVPLRAEPDPKVAFAADGSYVALSNRTQALVCGTANGNGGAPRPSPVGVVSAVAVHAWSGLLAAGGEGAAVVWDFDRSNPRLTCPGHAAPVGAVAFSPDGKLLATGEGGRKPLPDARVRVWDVTTGKELATCKGHTDRVSCVAFSPDGKLLASAGHDKTVRVWEAATGKEVRALTGHAAEVTGLAFQPGGRRLAAAGRGVRVWDLGTGDCALNLPGQAVAFSPDGKRLATAEKAEAALREADSGKELIRFRKHDKDVLALAFTADGGRLLTVTRDGILSAWDAPAPAGAAAGEEAGGRP